MTNEDIDTLKAFVQALAQQQQPLPDPIQQAMPRIGHALEQRDPAAIEQLRDLAETYKPLHTAYRRAYQNNLRQYHLRQYQAQERIKGFNGTAAATWETHFVDRAAQLLIANESPAGARRLLQSLTVPSPSRAKADAIREKGNRLFAMAAGGAFLGGAIAHVPGAIVGMILAVLFGWFSSPTRANPDRMS